jgi:hypothetical protein
MRKCSAAAPPLYFPFRKANCSAHDSGVLLGLISLQMSPLSGWQGWDAWEKGEFLIYA